MDKMRVEKHKEDTHTHSEKFSVRSYKEHFFGCKSDGKNEKERDEGFI